ncbi:unnamed protein product [[Candida] boidinii]|nr:unnamed protein product [[Candida] boidinii]
MATFVSGNFINACLCSLVNIISFLKLPSSSVSNTPVIPTCLNALDKFSSNDFSLANLIASSALSCAVLLIDAAVPQNDDTWDVTFAEPSLDHQLEKDVIGSFTGMFSFTDGEPVGEPDEGVVASAVESVLKHHYHHHH